MSEGKKINILAVYRSQMSQNRGTSIRARSILQELANDEDVSLSVATWDKVGELDLPNHFHMNNDHVADVKMLIRHIKENDIDIVIGHTIASYYYLIPIKLFTKAKIMLEMHGFLELEENLYKKMSPFRFYRLRMIHSLFYRFVDLITTCSDSATEYLLKYNKESYSIYGGVNLDFFNPDREKGGFLKRDEGDIILGYAGDARIWQGLPFLFESYKKLHAEHPEFKLALLTSEDRYDSGEGVLRVPSVQHDEVAGFFQECDVLVLPRPDNPVNRVTYPSKLMEYLAMGKAVVASRTSDCYRIISHKENGMLFDPEDTEGFIEVMLELRDEKLRNELGEKAHETAKNYTWDKQAALVKGYIQGVL